MFWIFDYLWILWSRTFGMPNDKMQEYLDINLILETSFALRNGILWKSLIQLIYINISKLIYQQLIFQQLIFQQVFYPTANLSTANLSTANLSTANLITVNFSKANFATAFKQGSRNFNPKLWQLGTKILNFKIFICLFCLLKKSIGHRLDSCA